MSESKGGEKRRIWLNGIIEKRLQKLMVNRGLDIQNFNAVELSSEEISIFYKLCRPSRTSDCVSLLRRLANSLENKPRSTFRSFLSNSNNMDMLFRIFIDLNNDPYMRQNAAFCFLILLSTDSDRKLSFRLAHNLGVYLTQFLSLDEKVAVLCCLILGNLVDSDHQKVRDILFSQNCHVELASFLILRCPGETELTEDALRVLFLLIYRDGFRNKAKIESMLQSMPKFSAWIIETIDLPEIPSIIARQLCWILPFVAFYDNFILSESMLLRSAKFLERLCNSEALRLDIIVPLQRTFGIYFSSDKIKIEMPHDFLTLFMNISLKIFGWHYIALHKECLFCLCNAILKLRDGKNFIIDREFFASIVNLMRNSLSEDIIRLGLSLLINLKIMALLPQSVVGELAHIERLLIDGGRLSCDLSALFREIKLNTYRHYSPFL